jgi:ppGpp synthetase/RelA/SpoT-type nucleotidyltranferase
MFNISGFLEKFKKFDQNRTLQTENIIKSIEDVVGVRIDKKNIVIKNGILRIQGSPALRQEIFLKKEHLLSLIKTEGIFDIR